MAQLYLLSVLFNIVAGLTLAGDYLGDRIAILATFKNLRKSRTGKIVVGACALAVGLFTLFIRAPGDTVPIAGDLLPSLAAIAQGLALIGEAFRKKVEARGEQAAAISKAILTYRVPAGIAGVCIGLAHFLFPAAVIL